MRLKEELLHLLRTDAEAREDVRHEVLPSELLAMPPQLHRIAGHLELLATAQQRTEERMAALAAAQQRTEERLEALVVTQQDMAEQLAKLGLVVDRLDRRGQEQSEWRRGEEGRREGERYERDTIGHAVSIFGGGRSVSERPDDLDRLRSALEAALTSPDGLEAGNDPFHADILRLKGHQVVVAGVSLKVDTSDVTRAERRAATLRSVGLDAVGVVIGREWASVESERSARERGVEWRVGESASGGYVRLRRLRAG